MEYEETKYHCILALRGRVAFHAETFTTGIKTISLSRPVTSHEASVSRPSLARRLKMFVSVFRFLPKAQSRLENS